MKKKVLGFAVIFTMVLMVFSTVASKDYLKKKVLNPGEGGGGGYIPESCTSSTSCWPEYTDRVMPFSGNIYCCSKNEQGVTGKAKQ